MSRPFEVPVTTLQLCIAASGDENLPQVDEKDTYGEDYKPIYGLLERQRHKWAARFIWRRYLAVSALILLHNQSSIAAAVQWLLWL
mgnify:CR=1 FL=1